MLNKPKMIFLSGTAGFIASNLMKALQKNGYQIIGSSRTAPQNESGQTKILSGNFYDTEFLKQLGEYPIDIIVHSAAIRGESDLSEAEYNKVNVKGTEALLKFAKENQVSRFLFLSTVGVLGTIPAPQPASAKNTPHPDNTYHRSKWQAEEIVRRFHSDVLRTITLRPTITYGPGDNGFVFKLDKMIRSRKFIFPRKTVRIHLLNIKALANLVLSIIQKDLFDGQSYLVADREAVLLKNLVDAIALQRQGRTYPDYMQFPDILFELSKKILKSLGKSRMLTSLQLISDDWTYDIRETIEQLNYQPVDTLESFAAER